MAVKQVPFCPNCLTRSACELIPHIPTGSGLCAAALTRCHRLSRGTRLVRQGDPFSALYLVRKGSLKTQTVTPDGQLVITNFLFPGDILGLEALGGSRHTADAIALEQAELCEFDCSRLLALCRQEHAFGAWLIDRLGYCLQRKDLRLCWITRMKCNDRLLRFFVELHDRLAQVEPISGDRLRKPMTKHDIAMYLNMSPETLSRSIAELREAGVLRVDGSTFSLNNIESARQRTCL